MPDDRIAAAEDLLRAREARGLRVPVITRICFTLYSVVMAVTGPLAWGAILIILATSIPVIGANVYFLLLLRRARRVRLVGLTGAVLDAGAVLLHPAIMYLAFFQPSQPVAVVSKVPWMVPAFLIIMVINSLALRPAYPIIITGAALVAHLGLIGLSIGHPGVTWAQDPVEAMTGSLVCLDWTANAMVFLLIAGAVLAWLTHGARRTVVQAARLEAERLQIVREQANLLMESRIGALGELVAGISHEMNNPLGAIKANAETWSRAVGRIRDSLRRSAEAGRVDDGAERILGALEQNSRGTREATERMGSTLETLRSFTRLDEAEYKEVNVHEALDSTLALIPPETSANVQVVRQYGEVPTIQAYAGRLNQVFLTLLTNAFEAIEDEGTVTITTRSEVGEISIRIADTGQGVPSDQLERIFDVNLETGNSRVAAGFGMAACHSIVDQHQGRIQVESSPGSGTSFTIALPIR